MIGRVGAVPSAAFGHTPDGQAATVYTLENSQLRVRITDYGGRMVSIETPDRLGRRGDVLLGFDDAAAYAKGGGAFGALLGRNANRIAGGSFTLDGPHLPPANQRRHLDPAWRSRRLRQGFLGDDLDDS
jgi:aldose 1-epimerase